ncbi:hypothetical protein DFH27DRAFT_611007 [Peziza echinospora]|nr:hypothetical protein DFH27DRAFT_611007 [Peziza echinospora]
MVSIRASRYSHLFLVLSCLSLSAPSGAKPSPSTTVLCNLPAPTVTTPIAIPSLGIELVTGYGLQSHHDPKYLEAHCPVDGDPRLQYQAGVGYYYPNGPGGGYTWHPEDIQLDQRLSEVYGLTPDYAEFSSYAYHADLEATTTVDLGAEQLERIRIAYGITEVHGRPTMSFERTFTDEFTCLEDVQNRSSKLEEAVSLFLQRDAEERELGISTAYEDWKKEHETRVNEHDLEAAVSAFLERDQYERDHPPIATAPWIEERLPYGTRKFVWTTGTHTPFINHETIRMADFASTDKRKSGRSTRGLSEEELQWYVYIVERFSYKEDNYMSKTRKYNPRQTQVEKDVIGSQYNVLDEVRHAYLPHPFIILPVEIAHTLDKKGRVPTSICFTEVRERLPKDVLFFMLQYGEIFIMDWNFEPIDIPTQPNIWQTKKWQMRRADQRLLFSDVETFLVNAHETNVTMEVCPKGPLTHGRVTPTTSELELENLRQCPSYLYVVVVVDC